jgi:hypothetical protein
MQLISILETKVFLVLGSSPGTRLSPCFAPHNKCTIRDLPTPGISNDQTSPFFLSVCEKDYYSANKR